MACCGKKPNRNKALDNRGNTISKRKNNLKKYAYLNPNQLAIRKAQEEQEQE